MRTRTGKIARLPATIREELNRRFNNAPWLKTSSLAERTADVKRVMNELFGGRPITEDNLSQWRRGGFQDWLRDEERRARLRQITERYEKLGPEEGARRSEAHFYQWMAAELMTELQRLSTMTDRNERWKRFKRSPSNSVTFNAPRPRQHSGLVSGKVEPFTRKPTCVRHLARPCNSLTH